MSGGVRDVATGRTIGRFVYASKGVGGWGVAEEAGEVGDDAVAEALLYLERLNQPTAAVAPPVADRARRMLWIGAADSARRFLFRTIVAGDDSSHRPNNNVTDCFVVEQLPAGAPGCPPPLAWSSSSWQSAYGPGEIANISLATGGSLQLDVDSAESPLIALSALAAENREPSLIAGVELLLRAVGTRGPAAPVTVLVDHIDYAPIFLGAVFSLLPFDVAWASNFEIRSISATQSTPFPGVRVLARDAESTPSDAIDLTVVDAADDPLPFPTCSFCGEPRETWLTLLLAALQGLREAISAGESTDAVEELTRALVDLVGTSVERRVPAAEFPQTFTQAALEASGHLKVAALIDSAAAWSRLANRHQHKRPTIAAPRPKAVPSSMLQSEYRLRVTKDYLTSTRPTVATNDLAEWYLEKLPARTNEWEVLPHLKLGAPNHTLESRIEAYLDVAALYPRLREPEWVRQYPLAGYVNDQFLSDVVSAIGRGEQKPFKKGMPAGQVAARLDEGLQSPQWPTRVLTPSGARAFVSQWLWEKRGAANDWLSGPAGPVPLAFVLLTQAIRRATSPAQLLAVRAALTEARNKPPRRPELARFPGRLTETLDQRLIDLLPARSQQPPMAPQGQTRTTGGDGVAQRTVVPMAPPASQSIAAPTTPPAQGVPNA